MTNQKQVTFVRGYHGYVPGDVARFDADEADALIAKGLVTDAQEVAAAEAVEANPAKDKAGKGETEAGAPKGESK